MSWNKRNNRNNMHGGRKKKDRLLVYDAYPLL